MVLPTGSGLHAEDQPKDPCKSQDLTVTIDLGEDEASNVAISEGNVDTAALKTAKGEADAAFEALRSARDDLRKAASTLRGGQEAQSSQEASTDSGVLESLTKTKKGAQTAKDSADEKVSEKSDALRRHCLTSKMHGPRSTAASRSATAVGSPIREQSTT